MPRSFLPPDHAPDRPSRTLATASDARLLARRRQPRLIFDFIDGAAGTEAALWRNTADLRALRLLPRVLADVATIDCATQVFGRPMGAPYGIAPMGMCDLAWPGTDHAFSAEARKRAMPVCVSTASSTPLEEMISRAGGHAWFQLYVTGSVDAAFALSDRAAAAVLDAIRRPR